jgi:hypothetical protein
MTEVISLVQCQRWLPLSSCSLFTYYTNPYHGGCSIQPASKRVSPHIKPFVDHQRQSHRVLTTPEHPCIQIVSLIVLYSEGSCYLCITERCSRKRKQKALPSSWVIPGAHRGRIVPGLQLARIDTPFSSLPVIHR